MKRLVFVVFACCALSLSACDGEETTAGDEQESGGEHETEGEHETGSEGEHESGDEQGDTEEESVCATEDRVDAFELGLTKTGELMQASFVSADPAPPGKDNNTWVLMITDLEGQPLTDLDIVVVPWMPDHGHGTPVETIVTPLETPGEYELSPVNMFMNGYWETTLELSFGEGESDSISFGFCVE